jgi:hypothetical protein
MLSKPPGSLTIFGYRDILNSKEHLHLVILVRLPSNSLKDLHLSQLRHQQDQRYVLLHRLQPQLKRQYVLQDLYLHLEDLKPWLLSKEVLPYPTFQL